MQISETTRRDVLDYILGLEEPFYGRLELLDFLSRVWDLETMKSTDHRFDNAWGDIWQHMINNHDWDDRYLLYVRLDLIHADDQLFLKFLEQCVHPVTRTEPQMTSKLLTKLNDCLINDGLQLVQSSAESGEPVYSAMAIGPASVSMSYDFFICHASEDKEAFVRKLAAALQDRGKRVWFDEFELRTGDSLRRKIDDGLSNSRFGVVVLSKAFFSREWPQREMDGLMAREVEGRKVILPVWYNITEPEVRSVSPILADRFAIHADVGIETVADTLVRDTSMNQVARAGSENVEGVGEP